MTPTPMRLVVSRLIRPRSRPTSLPEARAQPLGLRKSSFILWLAVMTLHLLRHLLTARFATRDWYRPTHPQVRGAGLRQSIIATNLALGLVLGVPIVPRVGPWLVLGHPGQSR